MTFLGISSCSEKLKIEGESKAGDIVVSGSVTTDTVSYEINIQRSAAFASSVAYETVNIAEVYVIDSDENKHDFSYDSSSQIYLSDPNEFRGVEGLGYQLHVELPDGSHIASEWEFIFPLPRLDSVFIRELVDDFENQGNPNLNFYFMSGLIDDVADEENYYRWRIYVNGVVRNEPEEMVLFDDDFTDGNLFQFDASNVLFQSDDEVFVEHISLGENAYQFFLRLRDLTSNVESAITKSYPIRGNMRDINGEQEVLGIFSASSVQWVNASVVNP